MALHRSSQVEALFHDVVRTDHLTTRSVVAEAIDQNLWKIPSGLSALLCPALPSLRPRSTHPHFPVTASTKLVFVQATLLVLHVKPTPVTPCR
jgi:hypothetical protein